MVRTDGCGAAEHLATRVGNFTVIECLLGGGRVVPVLDAHQ